MPLTHPLSSDKFCQYNYLLIFLFYLWYILLFGVVWNLRRQKNLLDLLGDKKSKSSKKSKKVKPDRDQTAVIRSKADQELSSKQVQHLDRKKPKVQYYKCDCGLTMHWTVAEGRRDGCPQCGRPIPLSSIFVTL